MSEFSLDCLRNLVCDDNLSFMQTLDKGRMKLIVTSPPYNLGKDYEKRISLDAYIKRQERVIEKCIDLLHPQGSLCWQVGNYVENGDIVPLDTILYPIFRAKGLRLRNRIVWQFGHGLHSTKRLSGRYETINWWTKGDNYTWNLDPIRVPSKYPESVTTRARISGNFQGTLRARTLATYGRSQTSRAITWKRQCIPASSLWNSWSDWYYP